MDFLNFIAAVAPFLIIVLLTFLNIRVFDQKFFSNKNETDENAEHHVFRKNERIFQIVTVSAISALFVVFLLLIIKFLAFAKTPQPQQPQQQATPITLLSTIPTAPPLTPKSPMAPPASRPVYANF